MAMDPNEFVKANKELNRVMAGTISPAEKQKKKSRLQRIIHKYMRGRGRKAGPKNRTEDIKAGGGQVLNDPYMLERISGMSK